MKAFGPDQRSAVVDGWSVVHVGTGLAAGAAGVPFAAAAVAAVAYEVGEQVVERTPTGRRVFRTTGAEHPANVAADLALFGLAWWAGSSLTGRRRRRPPAARKS